MIQKMTQWIFNLRPFRRREEWIEITVETNETWGVHWSRQSETEHCPNCGAETAFAPADAGSEFTRSDIEFLDRLIDNGSVHIKKGADKGRFICMNSLD